MDLNAHNDRSLAPFDNTIGSPSMIFTLSTDQRTQHLWIILNVI